jgi:hypothetical protein
MRNRAKIGKIKIKRRQVFVLEAAYLKVWFALLRHASKKVRAVDLIGKSRKCGEKFKRSEESLLRFKG